LTLTNVAEVTAGLLDPSRERFLALTDPDTGVIKLQSKMRVEILIEDKQATYLLVGFVSAFGVTNLSE
jgi:hypothetical protein